MVKDPVFGQDPMIIYTEEQKKHEKKCGACRERKLVISCSLITELGSEKF